MTQRIDVRLGLLLDHAKRLEGQAAELKTTVSDLETAVESLRATTAGEASQAAVASSLTVLGETQERIDRLKRNATVLRNLADIYDTCDLSGARVLGAG